MNPITMGIKAANNGLDRKTRANLIKSGFTERQIHDLHLISHGIQVCNVLDEIHCFAEEVRGNGKIVH